MLGHFLTIIWNIDPEIIKLGPFSIRYYSILLALGFLLAYIVMCKTMKAEGFSQNLIDKFSIFAVLGTVIGLRLGHCFFYGPYFDTIDPISGKVIEEGYLSHPLSILKVWEGGLASHGGAMGILLALFIYAKMYKQNYLRMLDKVVMVVPLVGAFVRVGNLMNSEIIGSPTDLPWGFVFTCRNHYNGMDYSDIPLHPSQLYEAIFYFIMFASLYFVYKKFALKWKGGTFLGLFLIILFGFRFLIEFIKLEQSSFEKEMLLDMGQILSIPFVLLGVFLVVRQFIGKKEKSNKLENSHLV